MCPRARVVDQLSRATRAHVQGPADSTSSPGRIALGSVGLRGRPAVLGVSGPSLRACGVSSCAGPLTHASEGPQCLPGVPGDSVPCPMSHRVHQLSQVTWVLVGRTTVSTMRPRRLGPVIEGSRCGPTVLGNLGWYQRHHGVDQMSPATPAYVGVPKGSTRSPGRFRPGSKSPRVRPAVYGHSGPCPTARGVEQLSRMTLAWSEGTRV